MITVFSVSSYRRKHMQLYISHNVFRPDNAAAYEIRKQSMREAQEDAAAWLKSEGNVAVSSSLQDVINIRRLRLK